MIYDTPDLLEQFSQYLIKDEVSIVEFAESDKYCGKLLYPRQRTLLKLIFLEELDSYDMDIIEEWTAPGGEVEICPNIFDRIDYLKANGYPHFRIAQLVGGRRSSKGFLGGLIIAYKLYQLTQIDNVVDYYGIQRGKDIYFSIVADSLDQAKAHQFGDAVNWVIDTRPLKEQNLIHKVLAENMSVYTPYDRRRLSSLLSSGVKIDRDLATLKVRAFGTNARTIRGQAAIVFCFDEHAHMIAGESRMSDDELYKAAIPSLTQFRKDGMILSFSSPYNKQGKFFELYEQSLELDNNIPVYPEHFMLKFPSWELYKDRNRVPGLTVGAASSPDEDREAAQEEKKDPESFKVEMRAQFAEVQDAFLRPEMVDRMFDPEWNKSILDRDLTPQAGAFGFMTYAAHADPSSVNKNFGIAIGHIEEITNTGGVVERHVVFDFINAFYPEDFEGHTIDWLEVVPEIVMLINNFRPREFTFDQFESDMAMQTIRRQVRELGIGETMVIEDTASFAKNYRQAKNFRMALNLGRVHSPHWSNYNDIPDKKNPIWLVQQELKFLQDKNGRVDHPTIGPIKTKDISDCIIHVVDHLVGSHISEMMEGLTASPQFGVQAGIGKPQNIPSELEGWYPTHKAGPAYIPARGINRNPVPNRYWG